MKRLVVSSLIFLFVITVTASVSLAQCELSTPVTFVPRSPFTLSQCRNEMPVLVSGGSEEDEDPSSWYYFSEDGAVEGEDGEYLFNPKKVIGPTDEVWFVYEENGCKDSASVVVSIKDTTFVNVSFADVCASDSTYDYTENATISPSRAQGGTFTPAVFNPKAAGIKSHRIVYRYTNEVTGCVSRAVGSLTVNPLPQPQFNSSFPSTFCEEDTGRIITFFVTPRGGQFTWQGGSGNVFNPSVQGKGDYLITYTYTESTNGCTNQVSKNVKVVESERIPRPVLSFEPVCEGETTEILLNNAGAYVDPVFIWSLNNNEIEGDEAVSGMFNHQDTISIYVRDQVCAGFPDTKLESERVQALIEVNENPVLDTVESIFVCEDQSLEVEANVISGNVDSYQWQKDSESPSYSLQNILEVEAAGDYNVVGINSITGCMSAPQPFEVSIGSPNVALELTSEDDDIRLGQMVTLTSTHEEGNARTYTYRWFKNDLRLTNDTQQVLNNIPVQSDGSGVKYRVEAFLYDGCVATDELMITIHLPIMVPNGFAPDDDGDSDFWTITNIESYPENHVEVYNRWGSLVWEADNYDNEFTVWDGKNQNDKEVPVATYYYVIDLRNEEGETFAGSVSVVR